MRRRRVQAPWAALAVLNRALSQPMGSSVSEAKILVASLRPSRASRYRLLLVSCFHPKSKWCVPDFGPAPASQRVSVTHACEAHLDVHRHGKAEETSSNLVAGSTAGGEQSVEDVRLSLYWVRLLRLGGVEAEPTSSRMRLLEIGGARRTVVIEVYGSKGHSLFSTISP